MSTFVDSVVILPHPAPAADVMRALNDLFLENGGSVTPETSLIFNDFQDEEREPELVGSPEELMDRILSWPGLGGGRYSLPDCAVIVFVGGAAAYQADFVTLSVSHRAYSAQPQARRQFDHLTAELHARLGAVRTISGFELLSPASWIPDEVERVRRGTFAGEYERDLRTHGDPAAG